MFCKVQRFFLLVAVLAAGLFFAGCNRNFDDIEVKDVHLEKIGLSSVRSVDAVLVLEIDNPTSFNLQAEQLRGAIFRKNQKIATYYSDNVMELPSKKVSQNKIKVRVTFDNQEIVGSMLRMKDLKPEDFTFDFEADIRYKMIKVPYKNKGIPVKDIYDRMQNVLQNN